MFFSNVFIAFFVCCTGVVMVFFMNGLESSVSKLCLIKSSYPSVNEKSTYMKEEEYLASSVWCLKRLDGTKTCHFKNLYFLPHFKGYLIFLLNEHSKVSGVESPKTIKEINLSTVKNLTGLHLKLIMITSSKHLSNNTFLPIENNIFIMKRFKPDNMMHVIHDDLLPLFLTYQELCKDDIQLCLSYQLLFVDDNDDGPFYNWYALFSNNNRILLNEQETAVRIDNSVIGLSHDSVWFQYGFKRMQGPVLNSNFSGLQLRPFTDFIKSQFGIKKEHGPMVKSELILPIIFLSRKINRKILNEYEVENNIRNIYTSMFSWKSVDIFNTDLSTHSSESILSVIQHSNLLIGMHGSAMMLAIFLPQGSTIIELFPFGIQPEYVSPLKALCSLPHMYYHYKSWVNDNEKNTKTHPEYSQLQGGILHLSLSEQEIIKNTKLVPPVKCCHNPVYLFRMFQDTIVDESFYDVVHSVVNKSVMPILNDQEYHKEAHKFAIDSWYFPPPVFNLTCKCVAGVLNVSWSFPIGLSSEVKFSVATSLGFTAVTESCQLLVQTQCSDSLQPKATPAVWVKTLQYDQESVDSFKPCTLT